MDPSQISQEIEREVLAADGQQSPPPYTTPPQQYYPYQGQQQYQQPPYPGYPFMAQPYNMQAMNPTMATAVTQEKPHNILLGFIVPTIILIIIVALSLYSKNYIASTSVAQITKAQITNNNAQAAPKESANSSTSTPEMKEEPTEPTSPPETPQVSKIAR